MDATFAHTPPVLNLPFEIYLLVIEYLSSEDLSSLGMACKALREITRDNGISHTKLQSTVPFARELDGARATGDYGRRLRARTKRLDAIANLAPYAAAVVAMANTYIYADDTLVYVHDRVLRVLPLGPNVTARRELRVDVRALLDAALPESRKTALYTFRPVHYAAGIVSCTYAHHRVGAGAPNVQEDFLVFFNPETGWSMSCRAPFPHHCLFVRNNKEHLVYGMYTARSRITPAATAAALEQGAPAYDHVPETGGYGNHRHWRLRHYDLVAQRWTTSDSFRLLDIFGLGVFGRNVCFEIIDGYFYAVSTEQRYFDREQELEYMATPQRDDFFLHGQDGTAADPTGDYYTDGDDDDDNSSSIVDLVPSDDESSEDNSRSSRSSSSSSSSSREDEHQAVDGSARSRASLFTKSAYYSCVRFPLSEFTGTPALEQPTLKSRWRRHNCEGTLDARWTTMALQKSAQTGSIVIVEQRKEWLGGSGKSRRTYYSQPLVWPSELRRQAAASPASPSTSLKHKIKPRLSDLQPQKRMASNVHPGDDASVMDPPTLGVCHGRFYARDAAAFVDLVSQNTAAGQSGSPNLILRAGSRTLSHAQRPNTPKSAHPDAAPLIDHPLYPSKEISSTYVDRDVRTWPDAADLHFLGPVLNPPGCTSAIVSAWDDRLLVYSIQTAPVPGSAPRPKPKPVSAIVVVSFDPTLRLPGLKPWGDRHLHAVNGEPNVEISGGDKDGRLVIEALAGTHSWATATEPSYVAIKSGYDFSYHCKI